MRSEKNTRKEQRAQVRERKEKVTLQFTVLYML